MLLIKKQEMSKAHELTQQYNENIANLIKRYYFILSTANVVVLEMMGTD